jgi:hypothetical protein
MIFSAQQLFSDDQAITATAISANVIDLGAPGTPYDAAAALNQDIGKGAPIPVLVQVTEDFATLDDLTVTIESAANAGLSSSAVVAYSSGAIATASLVQGYQFSANVLPDKITGRYLGIRYTVGGSNATTGKITAGIVMGRQTNLTGA